jgi:hypothetical protein
MVLSISPGRSAYQAVSSITVLTDSICSFLDFKTLVKIRPVNKFWAVSRHIDSYLHQKHSLDLKEATLVRRYLKAVLYNPVFASLPSLQALNLDLDHFGSDASLMIEAAADCRLVRLDLIGSRLMHFPPDRILQFALVKMSELRSLSIDNCVHLKDDTLKILRRLPNLTSLHLDRLRSLHGGQQPNEVVATVLPSLINLRTLSLDCDHLSDAAFSDSLPRLAQLRSLTLWWCHKLTDAAFTKAVPHLVHLESFSIRMCPGLTDAFFRDAIPQWKALTTLHLVSVGKQTMTS